MAELNGLENERLQIIQLLNGEDIATEETAQAMPEAARPQKIAIHGGAAQSANFIYLIIDRETKECACVDAAWDTTGLLRVCQALELNLVAALYTHRHVDHVGGIYQEGIRLEGLSNLALAGVPALMGSADVESTREACMIGTMAPQIVALDDGDIIPIGGIKVKALLTPGHTSGGVCFACGGDVEDDANIEVVITGDTLFVGAFGNLENEEEAPAEMYESIQRLARLPDMVAVLPGHNYGDERMSRIINEKQTNPAMRCTDVEQFRIVAGIDPPPEGLREITPEEAAEIAKGTKVPEGFEPQHRGGVRDRPLGQGVDPDAPPPDPALKAELEKGWEFLTAAAAEKDAVQTETGLVYKETVGGSGAVPTQLDTVEVHYEGRLIDGTVFDSSIARGETISFPLSGVIAGWTEGLQLMREGGKATLVIPSDLGYGAAGSPPSIPGGATLVFDVELISIASATGGVASSGAAAVSSSSGGGGGAGVSHHRSGWLLPTPPAESAATNLFRKLDPRQQGQATRSAGVVVVCPCVQPVKAENLIAAGISPLWCRSTDDYNVHHFVAPRF